MKELTFREVIANIKKGEVWEDDIFEVDCTESEAIRIKDKHSGFIFSFHKEDSLQLKRKKYSFAEAFKAYEEGKEIESCINSDWSYKLGDCELLVYAKEIKGEWYIND